MLLFSALALQHRRNFVSGIDCCHNGICMCYLYKYNNNNNPCICCWRRDICIGDNPQTGADWVTRHSLIIMILIVFSWLSQRHSLGQFSWSGHRSLTTVRNSGSEMESFLYFTFLFSLILRVRISRAENINTTTSAGQLEEKFLRSGDSHIENLTIQLSVEPLPQPSPLIGTFPHDFQLLPSTISRRTSYHDRPAEGHNYEEQGDVFLIFFKTENMFLYL